MMIGKTIAHYEITSQLGKGGMGEVYQAKDQKLGRDVAIKVLPDEFARDADRVARFQREAKLLASLNHPNIAAIYGLEESEGTNFLILELVEGETLADRIKKGPIPVEEALKLALQIAEALEAAHEKGVIHRDLKPANIKVTPEGKIKVLDLGLAKAFAEDQGDEKPQDSPTLSAAATRQGFILGTAAYMSPEQARGKPIDKRTDIWAFGVVLYEMLTGKNLFEGEDVTSTLARVLERSTDFSRLPPNLHPRIRFLLERCLEKAARNRYGSINDARVDIQKVLADPGGIFVQPLTAIKPRKKLWVRISWIAAVFILGLILAGTAVWKLKPTEPRQVMRFEYDLPEGQTFTRPGRRMIAVSADGMKIVYVANQRLYLKNSNELTAKSIQGSDEDPAGPFFSPDGQWIGYFDLVNHQLKKIPVTGGSSVKLCEVKVPFGADWGSDGFIVFGELGGVMRVSSSGGTPEAIVKGKGNQNFMCPQILPGGKSVLFTVVNGSRPQIAVQSLESGKRKDLIAAGPARYLSTGHLVYGLEDDLYAVPFDPDTLKITGGPVPLVKGVNRFMNFVPTQSAVSDSGTLVYIPGTTNSSEMMLVWLDREGKEELLSAAPGDYRNFAISPDGTKIALTISSGENEDIYVWDIVRKNMMKLTFDESDNSYPLWTPDSKRILFTSNRKGKFGIYRKQADGTGETELLGPLSDQLNVPCSWSDDGKNLVLEQSNAAAGLDIGMLSMEEGWVIKPLLKEKYYEGWPQVSPDGRWLAYVSNESGQYEIYVRPFPEVNGGKWKISTGVGFSPRWSPDGKEIYYWGGNGVTEVAVESGPTFKPGTHKTLFQMLGYVTTSMGLFGIPWDVAPDGKKFLMMKQASTKSAETKETDTRRIIVVLNWFEELKKKVPVN